MLDLLLRNAHVFAPEDLGRLDIGISGGMIVCLGHLTDKANRTIDCSGKIAIPGAIETHAHMLLSFGGTRTMNDFYDGTVAGAIGGVTTLIDFADQVRGGSAMEAFEARLQLAKTSVVDYSLHCTLTDINDATLKDIPRLMERGVTSFKFYTAYKAGGLYVAPNDMEKAFMVIAENGALATVHAEAEEEILAQTDRLIAGGKTGVAFFPQSRPDSSEKSAIAGVISLAKKTGAKLLIRHVTSAFGVEEITSAQASGQMVIGETCPHYLMLTQEVYGGEDGARYIVNPPIRGRADQERLWKALEDGVKFTIGTDDCSFYLSQKHVSDKFYEIPGGLPGIETRVPVMLTAGVSSGRLSMERLVHLLSTDVAKLYGIYPQKGTIALGSDADIVLIESCNPYPLTVATLHEQSDYTPFEGMQLDQRIFMTISCGRVLAKNGMFQGMRGLGRFLKRRLPADLDML
ncbi:MAG: dihydropyrimidinase [Clostridia bacterium]